LKEAAVSRKAALRLGIVVDHRRRNLSEEGKKLNVERILAYKQRLIIYPRKTNKPKKGDSTVGRTLLGVEVILSSHTPFF
jgi:large subunit ribosomal protein L13e